jgi:hypothetical protein
MKKDIYMDYTSTDIAVADMTEQFSIIKHKREQIEKIEEEIRGQFEKTVINFFKQEGFNFKVIDNKYDPINRYRLTKQTSENFRLVGSDVSSGKNVNFVPQFNIVPWEFIIKFEWWKSKNGAPTKVYWHPEEMSLQEFYNKKLKKVFALI